MIAGIPRNMNFSAVQDTFLSVEGIVAVHNLRIWGLTTDKTALSAHLAISKSTSDGIVTHEFSWLKLICCTSLLQRPDVTLR